MAQGRNVNACAIVGSMQLPSCALVRVCSSRDKQRSLLGAATIADDTKWACSAALFDTVRVKPIDYEIDR
jgi:hypothetical protein